MHHLICPQSRCPQDGAPAAPNSASSTGETGGAAAPVGVPRAVTGTARSPGGTGGEMGTPQHRLVRDEQEKGDPESHPGDFGGDGKTPPRGAVGQSQTPRGNGGSELKMGVQSQKWGFRAKPAWHPRIQRKPTQPPQIAAELTEAALAGTREWLSPNQGTPQCPQHPPSPAEPTGHPLATTPPGPAPALG